jgi:uncharacterized protein YggE
MLLATVSWRAEAEEGTIRAVGRAQVMAMPDRGYCSMYTQVMDADREVAMRQARASLEAALKQMSVPQTAGIRLDPHRYNSSGRVTHEPGTGTRLTEPVWSATSSATVYVLKQDSLEAVEATLGLVKQQAEDAGLMTYYELTTDAAILWQEALEKATKAAVAEARAMARGLGVTVRGYRYVGTTPEHGSPEARDTDEREWRLQHYSWQGDSASDTRQPHSEGSGGPVSVEATVYVTAVY